MTLNAYHRIIADNVCGFRKKRGFSQEKLAILTDLSEELISLIERERTNPTADVLFKIAQALKIEPHQLLQPEEHKKDEGGKKL